MQEHEMWVRVFELMPGISRQSAPIYAKMLQVYEMTTDSLTRDTIEQVLFLEWYDFVRARDFVAEENAIEENVDFIDGEDLK